MDASRRIVPAVDVTASGTRHEEKLLAPAEGGGHEVWAVERTCSPEAEGALKYTLLTD